MTCMLVAADNERCGRQRGEPSRTPWSVEAGAAPASVFGPCTQRVFPGIDRQPICASCQIFIDLWGLLQAISHPTDPPENARICLSGTPLRCLKAGRDVESVFSI